MPSLRLDVLFCLSCVFIDYRLYVKGKLSLYRQDSGVPKLLKLRIDGYVEKYKVQLKVTAVFNKCLYLLIKNNFSINIFTKKENW